MNRRIVSLAVVFLFTFVTQVFAAPLTVRLVNNNTNSPVVVSTGFGASVSCRRRSDDSFVSYLISAGNSESNWVHANGETLDCIMDAFSNSWAAGAGFVPAVDKTTVVIPQDGLPAILEMRMTPTDAVLTLSLKNKLTGLPIVTTNGSTYVRCTANNSEIQFRQFIPSGASSVNLNLTKKKAYFCSIAELNGYYTTVGFTVAVPSSAVKSLERTLLPLDSSITVNFKDENGAPLSPDNGGNYASFYCYSSGLPSYSFEADFEPDGSFNNYSFQVVGGQSYECNSDIFPYAAPDFSVDVPQGGNADVNLSLRPRDVTANFSFDLAGSPFTVPAGDSADLWCRQTPDGGLGRSKSLSSGDDSADLDLFSGLEYFCTLSGLDDYYLSQPLVFTPAANSTPSYVAQLSPFPAVLAVSLKDGNNNPIAAPENGDINCSEVTNEATEEYYVREIAGGNSSVDIKVKGGNSLSCYIDLPSDSGWENYSAIVSEAVAVASTGTTPYTIGLAEKDAQLKFKAVNEQGGTLTSLIGCSVYADQYEYQLQSSFNKDLVNSEAVIAVPSGHLFIPAISCLSEDLEGFVLDENEVQYFIPGYNPESKTVLTAGQTKNIEVKFVQPDSKATISVQNPQGEPLYGVYVYAVSAVGSDGSSFSIYGKTDPDGKVILPLKSGVAWTIQTDGYTDPETSVQLNMSSGITKVSPASGENLDRTIVLPAIAGKFSITTTTGAVPSGNGYCYAYNSSGAFAYSSEQPPLTSLKEIYVSAGDWKIGCLGWGTPTGSSDEIQLKSEEKIVNIKADTLEAPVAIELLAGDPVINIQESFDPAQEAKVEKPGVQVIVPAGSIGGSSAKISLNNKVTITPSELGMPKKAIEIGLTNILGNSIEKAKFNLTLSVERTKGATIRIRLYDNGRWRDIAVSSTLSVSAVNGLSETVDFAVTADQPGIYGVFVDDSTIVPTPLPTAVPTAVQTPQPMPISVEALKGLKVKVDGNKVKLSWKAATNALKYGVTLEKRQIINKKKQKMGWKLTKSKEATALNFTFKNLKAGDYRFTVQGVNGNVKGTAKSVKKSIK